MKRVDRESASVPVESPGRRRRPSLRGTRARRGMVLVWTVLMLFVMVLMVGLSLDMGMGAFAAHQLHNAADAGALAGAQWVKLDKDMAVARAASLAKANYAIQNDVDLEYSYSGGTFTNDLDIVLGRYYPHRRQYGITPWFEPDLVQPNAVMVTARRTTEAPDGPVGLVFGSMAGVETVDVGRYAIAFSRDNSGAGILALTPTGIGLRLGGDMTVHCPDGDIQVNSTSVPPKAAVTFNGNPEEGDIDAVQINLCGEVDKTLAEDCPVPYVEYADPIADPLANVPRPGTVGGTPGPEVYASPIYAPTTQEDPISQNNWPTDATSGKKELWPGYYPAGFKISGGDWLLHPGVYLLGGGSNGNSGLVIEGGTIVAEYCQFYITKSTEAMGNVYGQINITGLASVTITPPGNQSDPPVINGAPGVSIWQDDWNTNDAFIAGSSNDAEADVIEGTLYFPKNTVEVAGNNFYAGNQLVAWMIDATGTGDVYINYDGRNRGTAKLQSMLVE